MVYIRTAENLADLFTKAVVRGTLRHLLDKLLGYDPYTDEDAKAHSEEKAAKAAIEDASEMILLEKTVSNLQLLRNPIGEAISADGGTAKQTQPNPTQPNQPNQPNPTNPTKSKR